jgi:hypothetical protein
MSAAPPLLSSLVVTLRLLVESGAKMFEHAGFRPLWPVVAFIPWFLLGLAYLVRSAYRQEARPPRKAVMARLRPRKGHILWALAWGFAYLAAARGILADPPPAAPHACAAASQPQAKSLADRLYEKGDYQGAGECYEAAGDMAHADRAFVKATGPKSEEAARDLRAQADSAKALFTRVGQAFRSNH